MRQARLDQTDRRILSELQADGRITNVELARKVGISAPPCLRRVRALEDAGFIRGYAALLDDRALGFDVTAFATLLSASAMGTLRRPIEMMRRGQGGARGSLEETKSSRRRGGT